MKNKLSLKKMTKRASAILLSGVMLAGSCGMPVNAGAPQVKVDESVYVNMDYYGSIDEINIVKGCLLNGNTSFVDYGKYDDIINMTNRIEPQKADGQITWDLSGTDDNKFYYECKADSLKGNLPWNFDVTYKLNGVEKKGEELAGANGMVTIDIKATPNESADEYYRNNMILMCGTGVDMDKTLSIEAPGAQLQTFGTMKGVIFMALPGEESDFQINIGSEEFECMGIFFMMVPATLSSLEMINDIRDVKDTAKDSMDAISDATDAILDDLIAMKDNMKTTQSGLVAAKKAKSIYDENRGSLKADADAAIDSLENISSYLEVLNNEMEVSEDNYHEVMDRLDAMNKTINGLRDYYDDVDENVDDLEGNLRDMKKVIGGTVTEQGLENLAYLMGGDKIAYAKHDSDLVKPDTETTTLNRALPLLTGGATPSNTRGEYGLAGLLITYKEALKKAGDDPVLEALTNSGDLLDRAQDILDKIDSVLAQTDSLNHFMNGTGREDTDALIQQVEELINMTNVTLLTTASAMRTMRYTIDTMEPSLDTAVDSTLNGMIGLLGNSMAATDSMELVRNAKNIMKDAIDDEMDKIEDDSNILNLDVTEEFPSFTSDKNPSPDSIQIIMRTAEISIDDDDDNVVDLEVPKEDIGAWGRLKAIFVRIRDGITGIFK